MSKISPPLPHHHPGITLSQRPFQRAVRGRSPEAALFRQVVGVLSAHVRGTPTPAQEFIIARLAWLQVHLGRMDEHALKADGVMPDGSGKQYLAWANSQCRMLQALGLQARQPTKPSLAQHLAAKAAANLGAAK